MSIFKKMFGGGSGPPAGQQPKPAAPVDPTQTLARLEGQLDTIEKRITVMNNKVNDAKQTALAKKKAGDIRGATMAMKNMKMFEGEVTKLYGQQVMLQQQTLQIQSAHADVDVVNALKTGTSALENLNKQADVDTIADLQDQMAEVQQEVEERQELFAGAAMEGQDELLGELDELEAEAMAGELEGLDLGPMANVPIAAPAQPAAAQPAAA